MRLPTLKPSELIKALKKAGFEELRQSGSHLSLGNRNNGKIVTVPIHNRDLKRGLLFSIIKDAGISQEDLAKLL
ncbi:type II toxin-antitoxin system HicA family toxin [Candidatus Peribacteria bacterium]|jgi:predicted RNA binding protein YcfA (HicA-like mRNA interferase family)|nr:type II toxin-antitoxin system HicA family toxin [Candidatus Peribacteria bacterium]MBT4021064.1 type II toxin-antitoxin system HicA family toxin [Candidatus Peribacteria bacterium]MBT4240785.1 type II toxin-antitoxin system HicA family toxin [Candidatus Peribacteria bacterium]MBT4474186.1 type II toxin-antitoxin system HicA family toxin [Candidatus Peribacteria bacterium]